MSQAASIIAPTNDASHALLHGPLARLNVLIIAAALILASGICTPALAEWSTGKAPAGIFPDGHRIERLLDKAEKAIDRHEEDGRTIGRILSRFDGKFLDRIGTLVWLVFWVLIVALGSWALRELASVAKAAGEALKAFRREESE